MCVCLSLSVSLYVYLPVCSVDYTLTSEYCLFTSAFVPSLYSFTWLPPPSLPPPLTPPPPPPPQPSLLLIVLLNLKSKYTKFKIISFCCRWLLEARRRQDASVCRVAGKNILTTWSSSFRRRRLPSKNMNNSSLWVHLQLPVLVFCVGWYVYGSFSWKLVKFVT